MERIGIYGGTFNPPHIGHMAAARQAIKLLRLSKLLLIPDRIAPHKQLPENSPSPQQRLEMLTVAAADIPQAEVSQLELRREGPSYTYLTVEALKQRYPQAQLVLIMGTDMFLSFESWKNWRWLIENVTLAVLYRGQKGEKSAIREKRDALCAQGAQVELVENQVTAISSTDLRRMLAFQCASPFLPEGVLAYIRQQGLYETGRDLWQLPMDRLEQVVISLLKPGRVAHVLGCRDTAVELAKHWGADTTDAARAGILHDITKALDGPLQLTLCREHGIILDDFSTRNPKTLHALTGSFVAQRIFGENDAVVTAIRSHTTGRAGMGLLEKIIYVADYMEPNRDFPGVEELRRLAFSDLDGAMRLGLEMTVSILRGNGAQISAASLEALDDLNRNLR
ncbi:MAG: nicotinate (nicotinamide) nucleotide adenylyltransferase [Oscillospiraceae bacterium]|nr:nicotinate (nicotinamide) nucleotide adenylyltransferase [Oscillospiraceae bacterium]